jgi:hypothetical protein
MIVAVEVSICNVIGAGRLTSRENNTPPMGDPKATEMPEAAAADRTSRFRAAGVSAGR